MKSIQPPVCFQIYGDFKEEKIEKLAKKAVNKVFKMKGNHILRPKLIQKHDLLFFNIGLFYKNPVEESETDLPPHNGNELEQQHSSTPANDMMSKDSCASTVLLSCLASKPELEPQSETDASFLTKQLFTVTNIAPETFKSLT